MTAGDREALKALNSRLDHTAAIARLISRSTGADSDEANAIRGIAETLSEIAGRIDAIVSASSEGLSHA